MAAGAVRGRAQPFNRNWAGRYGRGNKPPLPMPTIFLADYPAPDAGPSYPWMVVVGDEPEDDTFQFVVGPDDEDPPDVATYQAAVEAVHPSPAHAIRAVLALHSQLVDSHCAQKSMATETHSSAPACQNSLSTVVCSGGCRFRPRGAFASGARLIAYSCQGAQKIMLCGA